jgi:hypothetical protein
MKKMNRLPIVAIGFTLFVSTANCQVTKYDGNQNTWTFTYLKANPGQKGNLKLFLEKNWFAMDSVAVKQNLLNQYELIENVGEGDQPEWDYIVAVEYFTKSTYADIAEKFEIIRKNHQTIKVNGLTLRDLGKIVKSETIRKKNYSN